MKTLWRVSKRTLPLRSGKTLWRVSKGTLPLRSGKTLWRVLKMGPPLAFGVRGLNAPPKGMTSLQPDHRQSPEAGEGSAPISGRAADGALAALCPFVSLALLVAAYASVSLGGVLAIERQHHRVKVRQFALHG